MSAVLFAAGLFAVLLALPQPVRDLERERGPAGTHLVDDWITSRLVKADLEHVATRPSAAWCGAAFAGGLLGAMLGSLAGFVVGFVVAGLGVAGFVMSRGDRTPQRVVTALPEFLEQVASSLRAGATLHDALGRSAPAGGPLASDIAAVFAVADRGLSLSEALEDWATVRPQPEVRAMVTMLAVGLATGTDLSSSCDQAASVLRQQAHLGQEIAALATQARASAMVIGLAPIAFLLVATAAGSSPSVLFSTPIGAAGLVGGLALDVVGLVWMHRIVSAVTP